MGNPSDSAGSVLDGYISEADLARQLNRSVRTLRLIRMTKLYHSQVYEFGCHRAAFEALWKAHWQFSSASSSC